MQLIKQLDQHCLNLAWSLWTELGVAGVQRKHQDVLILVEELILFTSVFCQIDPRLRDEAIDWCVQFDRFISKSRLKTLGHDFEELIREPFSQFAATVNAFANTNWLTLIDTPPLKMHLSNKSVLRPHRSAALLNIRARSVFGTSARADLITFFLVHPDLDFSVAETVEMGYTKRNLAEVLDDLYFGRLFNRFNQGNQQRYRLNKDSPMRILLDPIPRYYWPWRSIFTIILSLRACIITTEKHADSTKAIEIRNCLATLDPILQKLGLTPPPFSNQFSIYLDAFNHWLLEWAQSLNGG